MSYLNVFWLFSGCICRECSGVGYSLYGIVFLQLRWLDWQWQCTRSSGSRMVRTDVVVTLTFCSHARSQQEICLVCWYLFRLLIRFGAYVDRQRRRSEERKADMENKVKVGRGTYWWDHHHHLKIEMRRKHRGWRLSHNPADWILGNQPSCAPSRRRN